MIRWVTKKKLPVLIFALKGNTAVRWILRKMGCEDGSGWNWLRIMSSGELTLSSVDTSGIIIRLTDRRIVKHR
jgi:hypothetical protein